MKCSLKKKLILLFLLLLADVGHSVLFSNDQNLCSKAMINGLKAFNHKVSISSCQVLLKINFNVFCSGFMCHKVFLCYIMILLILM